MELDERVERLERHAEDSRDRLIRIGERLVRIETQQEEFTKYYATKADLLQSEKSITKWIVAALFMPFIAQLLPVILKKFGL
jgi:hypothetical protein